MCEDDSVPIDGKSRSLVSRRRFRGCAALLAAISLLAAAGVAQAASTYTISGLRDSLRACTGTVCPSLRAAVLAADSNPGSTVRLGAGTYRLGNGAGKIVGDGVLEITAGMVIEGAGARKTRIEQTDDSDPVVVVENGTVGISGVTLTGGKFRAPAGDPGEPGGSAVGAGLINAGSLTLDGVVVSGNSAAGGAGGATESGDVGPNGGDAVGGIFNEGSLTLRDSAVTGNTAVGGAGAPAVGEIGGTGGLAVGGIDDDSETKATLTLSGSTISDNTATGGEGGSTDGSTPGSAALGGYGGEAVGGVFEASAPITIGSSTIETNHATGGNGGSGTNVPGGDGAYAVGGVFLTNGAGQGSFETATIADNVATGGAGGAGGDAAGGNAGFATAGISDGVAGLELDETTVSGNIATGGTGGNGSGGGAAGFTGGVLGAGVADGSSSPLTVLATTISANIGHGGAGGAPGGGGGGTCGAGVFDNSQGIATFTGDTIADNAAESGTGTSPNGSGGWSEGGGVCFALAMPGTVTIVNSTIADNSAAGAKGAGSGTAGEGRGGGIWNDENQQSKIPVTLADDTVASNSSTTAGGNVYLNNGTGMTVSSTIIAGGTSGDAATSDCFAPTVTDLGHNLESTKPSQCGFSTSDGDLIGVNAQLGPLTDNGGPTQTLALGRHSPALGAGGSCVAAAGVDGRGLPRRSPCDIGAFELQPAPTLAHFSQSRTRWQRGSAPTRLSNAKTQPSSIGTTFRFILDEPAALTLTFARASSPRKALGTLRFANVAPGQAIIFDGRLSGHKQLAPGAYLVTLSATNVGTTRSKSLRFTVLKG